MNQQDIGLFLRKLREEKGMTQEQLAETVGVSNRTISRWENGRNIPDLSILVQLSEIFGVSFNEIVNAKRESENEQMESKEKEAILQLAKMYRNEKYVYPKQINYLLAFGIIGVIGYCLNLNDELNQIFAGIMAGIMAVLFFINTAYILLGKHIDGPIAGIGEKVFACTYKNNVDGVAGHLKQSEFELRFYPNYVHKENDFGFTLEEITSVNEQRYLMFSKVLVIKVGEEEYKFMLENKDRKEILTWYQSQKQNKIMEVRIL